MALTLDTAATTQPLSLDEVKARLRIDGDSEHADIADMIQKATAKVQTDTARQLITTTWKLTLDALPPTIYVPLPPLQSVTSVKYIDGAGVQQTLAAENYQVDTLSEPGRIRPAYGLTWPDTRVQLNAVEAIYIAGYGDAAEDVPEDLRQAIMFWVAQLYEFREPTITGTIVTQVSDTLAVMLRPYSMTGVG